MQSNEMESTTERLELRKFSTEDAPGFYLMNQDPEVMRFTGDEPFPSVIEARLFIQRYDHYAIHGFGRWSVYSRANHKYLGFCGLKYSPEKNEVDLGFRLIRSHWGCGLATEAATESLRLGFERYGLKKIVGRAMQANAASHSVLKKLGMTEIFRFVEDGNSWVQYELKAPSSIHACEP